MDILHCICPLVQERKFKVKVADFDSAVDTGGREPQSLCGIECRVIKPVWIKGTPFARAPEVGACIWCVCMHACMCECMMLVDRIIKVRQDFLDVIYI